MSNPASPRPEWPAYARTLSGALGISTAPILFALAATHPTAGAVWRFIYALPVLGLLCIVRREARSSFGRSGWIGLAALSGIFFAADMALWHHSIRLIGAGPATLLANTQVFWVAAIGLVLYGERPSSVFWSVLPLLAIGMFLLAGGSAGALPPATDRLGLAAGAASGLAYAFMIVFLRRAQLRATIAPEAALLVQILVALASLAMLGWLEGSLTAPLSATQHGWLLVLGVGVQAFAWILISGGIKRIPAHHGSMLLLAQPVASFVLAWLVLDQRPSMVRLAGAALVLVGIALPLVSEARRHRDAAV